MASLSVPPPPAVPQYILLAANSGSSFKQISQVAIAGVFVLVVIISSVVLVKALRFRLARRRGRDLLAVNLARFPNSGESHIRLGLDDTAVAALGTTYLFSADTGGKEEVAEGADSEAGEAGHARMRECSVCLEEYKEGQSCRTLVKCNHSFHQDCIDKWAKRHATCPLCRISLLDSKVEEVPHTSIYAPSQTVLAVNVEESHVLR